MRLWQPGRWHRMPCLNNPTALTLIIVDENGDEVAIGRGWSGDPDYHEEKADLIAGSPALLEACEAMLKAATPEARKAALELARTAVAGVRGRTS